ncbi:MAG: hypothetical protein EOO24_23300, partial [Comamonadaceae bacterium]
REQRGHQRFGFPGMVAAEVADVDIERHRPVLLAESHLCIHTWPEHRAVTLDVYVCNFGGDHSGKAEALMAALLALLRPGHAERHAIVRGQREPAARA